MKHRCIEYITFFSLLLSSSFSYCLDVDFQGQLVRTDCIISAQTQSRPITISDLHLATLRENGQSSITLFKIEIENCASHDVMKTVKLTWKSASKIDDYSFAVSSGNNSIALYLLDANQQQIKLGTPLNMGNIPAILPGNQKTGIVLNFGIQVRKKNQTDIQPGSFNAVAEFSVEYE